MADADIVALDHKQEATDGILAEHKTICEIIKKAKEESKQARFPAEMEWNKSWNLYNGIMDWSTKADWQSKIALPRVNTSVRAATYLLKRGLVGPKDFFQTDGFGRVSKDIAPSVHKIAKYHLNKGKFVNNYVSAVMAAMLNSLMILKVYPSVEEEDDVPTEWPRGGPLLATPSIHTPNVADILGSGGAGNSPLGKKRQRLRINYDPCSAYDFYPDAYGEGTFKIHEITMDWYKFKSMEESDPRFEKGVADLLTEDFQNLEKVQEHASRANQFTPVTSRMRKRVQLDEFWGDLIDDNGKLLFKNCYAVMVNEKYLAVKPRPAPYLKIGVRDPFVVAPIIERPFSVWHQSFVESVNDIAESLSELANSILDGNLYASIKAFEVDIDQVYNPADFQTGIFPGKPYLKRGGGGGTAPMIRDIQLGNFNPQVLEVLSALDKEFQSGTGLNEYITPQMRRGGGRVTAYEVAKKGQDSADFFGEVAHCQEEKGVEPCLNLTYKYAVAYQHDFTDPLLVELLGPEAATKAHMLLQDKDMRNFLLKSPLKFMANGMSEVTRRVRELDKIMAFINLIGNLIKVYPQVVQEVKMGGLIKKAIESFNWNMEDVLNVGNPVMPGMAPAPVPGNAPGMPPVGAPSPALSANGGAGQLASALR